MPFFTFRIIRVKESKIPIVVLLLLFYKNINEKSNDPINAGQFRFLFYSQLL